jgi:hypothetical protein
MAPLICTREDQQDVRKIIKEGGPRILLGQRMVFRANLGSKPRFYNVYSYDRSTNTFTLVDPATNEKLRSGAFPSDLYIGEKSREIGGPILGLIRVTRISTAPYMKSRPNWIYEASPPRSPARGRDDPRRADCAPPVSGPPALVVPRPVSLSAAMSPASLLAAPLGGPGGPPPSLPTPPSYPPGFGPIPPWGPPGFVPPPRPFSGAPYPGVPPFPPPPGFPTAAREPALKELKLMVEKLQSETRDIRSGGASGRSSLSAYAVTFIRKLHSGISSQDSPGLFSQISMAMEMALAPKDWAPILLLAFICTIDIKHIDMKLSWIAEGVFSETLGYCEAEG